jgi:hypothetical protein
MVLNIYQCFKVPVELSQVHRTHFLPTILEQMIFVKEVSDGYQILVQQDFGQLDILFNFDSQGHFAQHVFEDIDFLVAHFVPVQ